MIGDDSLIGAGALVTEGKVFAPGSMIIGSPARAVKAVPPETLALLKMSAAHYAERAGRYARDLERVDI